MFGESLVSWISPGVWLFGSEVVGVVGAFPSMVSGRKLVENFGDSLIRKLGLFFGMIGISSL